LLRCDIKTAGDEISRMLRQCFGNIIFYFKIRKLFHPAQSLIVLDDSGFFQVLSEADRYIISNQQTSK